MNAKLTFAERIGRYPFLRLAIPLIVGMTSAAVCSDWGGILLSWSFLIVGFIFIFLLFGVLFFIRCRLQLVERCNFFGEGIILFFFLFGFLHYQLACRRMTVDWPECKETYRALLVASPEIKPRSVSCEALVLPDGNERLDWRSAPKVMLVFRKSEHTELLYVGKELVFKEQIKVPVNRGNPDEFDYARFLFNRGVSGQVLLWDTTWQICSSDEIVSDIPLTVSLKIKAQQWRDRLLSRYKSAGLSGDEFALYSAMTLGDRSEMPQSLRQIYAAAGVSHVLALSGLHLCYLVALFGYVLKRFVRQRVIYIVGNLVAIALVWCFCLLAGMPSSLVRASLMYSLMLLGTLAERKGFSVNSLAASAFLMLCLCPLWLFDVSFQLSFLAMCGILGLGDVRLPLFIQRYKPLRFISESLLMSFKAQLATSPLVAGLFHTFSPYSALSTLLLTPFTAILLFSMPFSMLLTILPADWSVIWFSGLTHVIQIQHAILEELAGWPLAVVQLYPSKVMLIVIYLFLILWLCRHNLKFTFFIWSAVLLSVVFIGASWYNVVWRIKPALIFYNCPSCPSVHFVLSSNKSYLLPVWPDSVPCCMSDIRRTFWERRLTTPPNIVSQCYDDGILQADNGLVGCLGRTVLLAFDGRWIGGYAKKPYPIDYLFICRGMCTSLKDLSRLFVPQMVVLDASLRWSDRKLYVRECETLGWPVYDMSVHGALKVPLK